MGGVGPVRGQPMHGIGNQQMKIFVIVGTACTWHGGAAPIIAF